MKKLVLASLVTVSAMMADVMKMMPYVGAIGYDSSTTNSLKDDAKLAGLHTSVGNLNYLFEFAYSYTDIDYKSTSINNLKQHDIVIKYGEYYKDFSWTLGVHYINNNEKDAFKDLSDGYIAIVGVDGYTSFGYDKLTYGADMYYSRYANAHNDQSVGSTTVIDVLQFTPKVMYFKSINVNTNNTFVLKANYIQANDYIDSSYTSYEISDTLKHKSFFTTLTYNGGKMRSGVKNAGLTVYNTKDLLRDAYSIKIGHYFTPKFSADISYTKNNYEEYNAATLNLLPEGSSAIALISMSYSF